MSANANVIAMLGAVSNATADVVAMLGIILGAPAVDDDERPSHMQFKSQTICNANLSLSSLSAQCGRARSHAVARRGAMNTLLPLEACLGHARWRGPRDGARRRRAFCLKGFRTAIQAFWSKPDRPRVRDAIVKY